MQQETQKQPTKTLQVSYSNILERNPPNANEQQISIYGDKLDIEVVIRQLDRVRKAFPSISKTFTDMLLERVIECKFSNERLKDAIDNVIDNCKYPTPTIADFISFDKKIDCLTWFELAKRVHAGESKLWDFYMPVKMKNEIRYIRKE